VTELARDDQCVFAVADGVIRAISPFKCGLPPRVLAALRLDDRLGTARYAVEWDEQEDSYTIEIVGG
jgi:hypothetical protein